MTTDDLRSLIKAAATGTPGAKLWPNGLGFDHRGTQYTAHERGNDGGSLVWTAARLVSLYGDDAAVKYGEGPTPEAAKRAAGIGGRRIGYRE
jgi:hypothetical protein